MKESIISMPSANPEGTEGIGYINIIPNAV